MNIKKVAVCALALAMLVSAGCKDDSSEVVCENGKCLPRSGRKQVVEVDIPESMVKNSQLSQMDEPVNQHFDPIHESVIADDDIMTLAGAPGRFNDVSLESVEIPGVGHSEAAISGDSGYLVDEYQDNLWPGGVEQSAELDFAEF